MNNWYEFTAERVETAVKRAAQTIDEADLPEDWDSVVSDGSEWALLVTEQELSYFVATLASFQHGPDPRHGQWHDEALNRLTKHDGCDAVITELISERDDVLAAIVDARSYLFNDIYQGEFGDLYVDAELLLDKLRPRLRGTGGWNPLLHVEVCSECDTNVAWWNFLAEHEDWCPAEENAEKLEARREHLIGSHLYCRDIGAALIAHTSRCLDRLEKIAAEVHAGATEAAAVVVVRPRRILPAIEIGDLNVEIDEADPATLAVTIYPRMVDLDYCEEPLHTDPHRACRYLVS